MDMSAISEGKPQDFQNQIIGMLLEASGNLQQVISNGSRATLHGKT